MADQKILDEIKKKSQEIMSSNEELAARLRKNQEVISRFSQELEGLKTGGEAFGPSVKEELNELKSDLEEKKRMVTELIDRLKPVEIDIARREDIAAALQQRIDDQAAKIESLSKELVDNRKQVQLLSESNSQLKKQAAEKNSIIKLIKDKLTEKSSLLNSIEEKNKELKKETEAYEKRIAVLKEAIGSVEKRFFSSNEQNQKFVNEMKKLKEKLKHTEIELVEKDRLAEKASILERVEKKKKELEREADESKKEAFKLKNKISVIEKRVFSTNEQNQKLLYELMKMKERLKSAEDDLEEKDKLLEASSAEHTKSLKEFRKDEEEKKAMIIRNHSKKIAVMNATITSLKTKLLQQRRLIEEKARKEGTLINEFNSRMRELLAANPSLSSVPEDIAFPEESTEEETAAEPAFETESIVESSNSPPRIEEILPMIELARDHGDTTDQIKHSLLSSGYSENDIDEAFSRLNIIE